MHQLKNLSVDISEQAIRSLKSFNLILSIDQAHMLLVAHGIKPSVHTGFFSDPIETDHTLPQSHIDHKAQFGDIITNLGLKYKIQTKMLEKVIDNKLFHYEWVVFCIAKDTVIAEELFDAREKQDKRREGLLLGYPASAVEAFVSNDPLDFSQIPESTKHVSAEAMKFLNHRLSKDNCKEEIKYLSNYARALKHIDPELYEECVSCN